MCGIWALFGYDANDVRQFTCAQTIAHRGPDNFRFENVSGLRSAKLAFHRLEVVGDVGGMQPMRLHQYPHLTLICNGEIYNCQKLKEEFGFNHETPSDCEVILHLYNKFGPEETSKYLDGVFAYVIVNTRDNTLLLSRDTYGVRPMFYFMTNNGMMGVCSEAKGLYDLLKKKNGEDKTKLLRVFPPAHSMVCDVIKNGKIAPATPKMFHSFPELPRHFMYQGVVLEKGESDDVIKKNIRTLMINAVEKRLMSSRRVGSLLSGGLDSSLVAAITAKKLRENGSKQPIQTFSIGMETSPDIVAARKVAEQIESEHHEVIFSPEEGLDAIEETIYALESYDVTTVRASIPMYLLSKYISQNTDTIVIMSGEGADELAQGYIYFYKQPTQEEGDVESRRLLSDLYLFDVLRTDRSTAAHGLEVRAPFLDHALTSYYLSLPAEKRAPSEGNIEKFLLRSAFDESDLIPSEILWRRKEAFSDGVASKRRSWFEILQEHIESRVSDDALAKAKETHPFHTPKTKEALYYRQIFESKFGPQLSKLIPYQWLPKWIEAVDPSARVLTHYQNDEA
uniref:Asparagine synthetase [glutamine-hydrolyzing] n=1 Tax=Ciona intestinalis TaxID=7719 RepID=F6VL61_CIOIN|nr:asparagine synthetase [glutamine-hydrolyzing] [Ciona intestinalis]|eukprot:XP_009857699.1 asparagine synthetase [glutamine-hydrolyzing] [Ciona intestinalis]